ERERLEHGAVARDERPASLLQRQALRLHVEESVARRLMGRGSGATTRVRLAGRAAAVTSASGATVHCSPPFERRAAETAHGRREHTNRPTRGTAKEAPMIRRITLVALPLVSRVRSRMPPR